MDTAIVVNVPLEMEKAEGRCPYVGVNGRACGAAVRPGEQMCQAHAEWHGSLPALMGLPYPEDAISLHQFLLKILDLLVRGRVPRESVRAVETMCRLLSENLSSYEWERRRAR